MEFKMAHRVEFTIPFSELKELATRYAQENDIQIPNGGEFYFRIERDNQVGFRPAKPDQLGVKIEKS
jgi:hypothetical protein